MTLNKKNKKDTWKFIDRIEWKAQNMLLRSSEHTWAWSVRFGFCPSRLSADSILSSSLINSSAWPAVFRQR